MIQLLNITGLHSNPRFEQGDSEAAIKGRPSSFSPNEPRFHGRLAEPLKKDTVRFGSGPGAVQDSDFQRWRDILTSKVREDLLKFKSPSNFETTQDGKAVKVPQDYIDLPRFMRGSNEGGSGQGQGQPGDQVGEVGGNGQPQPGQGAGQPKPGQQPGQPGEEGEGEGEGDDAGEGSGALKPDDWLPKISRSEIARMIGGDLELPNFEPRGQNNIQKIEEIWDNISRHGTPGNRHLRKTYLNAMQREMSEQGMVFNAANIQWRKGDFKYFDTTEHPVPKENAVVITIGDVSGSMSAKRRKMMRDAHFYLSTYIQYKYGEINAELRNEPVGEGDFGNGVAEEFIIHDDSAEIVSESEFYKSTKSGGTKFAPAMQKVKELVLGTDGKPPKYPLDQWNVYVVHYTDGDAAGDDEKAAGILEELVAAGLNMYGLIQTEGTKNRFHEALDKAFGKDSKFVRKAHMINDNPAECKKAVYAMLGKDEVRATV